MSGAKHTAVAPALPNESIDFNKLHDAAKSGKLDDGIPDAAIITPEPPKPTKAEAEAAAAEAENAKPDTAGKSA